MHILLFLFYSLLLGWLVTRMRFFRISGIRSAFLLLFFGLHVFTGCLQNWVAYHFFPNHGDIWSFFEYSFILRHELLTDFHFFLADNSTWAYMPHTVLIMIQVILNWLSFDNLYIDTLLFSFPVFLGSFALFRTFRHLFPGDPLTALCAILLPSTLFWTSCIYTEGVLYALTGWLLYSLHNRSAGGWNLRRCFCCFFIFILAAFFRSSTFLTLLPALEVWGLIAKHTSRRRLLIYTGILILSTLLFVFLFPMWFYKLPQYLIAKQHEFQQLEGGSRLYLPMLEASWSSFVRILPWALRNGLFEPLPGSGGKGMYLAFAIELIFVWGIVLAALARKLSGQTRSGDSPFSFTLFCLFYSLSGMLLVGLIVPFAGAIVRYRSIYLPFLLAPFLHSLRLSGPIKKINIKLVKHIFTH